MTELCIIFDLDGTLVDSEGAAGVDGESFEVIETSATLVGRITQYCPDHGTLPTGLLFFLFAIATIARQAEN